MSNQADLNPHVLPFEGTLAWQADGSALCLYEGSSSENLGAWPVPRRGFVGMKQEDARGSVSEAGGAAFACSGPQAQVSSSVGVWGNF